MINGLIKYRGGIVKSFCKQFPEISDVWLDTGLGEMRTDGTYYDEISYPRVPMYVEAGRLTEFCGSISMVQCEKFSRITQFHQYDFTIIVNGDSMYPLFMKGDIYSDNQPINRSVEMDCKIMLKKSAVLIGIDNVSLVTMLIPLCALFMLLQPFLCRLLNSLPLDLAVCLPLSICCCAASIGVIHSLSLFPFCFCALFPVVFPC